MTSKSLSIGSTLLSPQRVDRDFVTSAKLALDGSAVRKGKTEASRILDEWTSAETLPKEQYDKLDSYMSKVNSQYRKLENQWWKLRKSDRDNTEQMGQLEQKMGTEGQVLLHQQKLQTELREATARAAVLAMTGTLSGIPGLVAAYSAYANSPNWTSTEVANTEAVIKEMEALATGSSEMVTQNNSVEQVHREKLWKSMNHLLDDSIEQAKSGKPSELDLQLYELTSFEMIAKIADSARAGNKVRLNLDAGRLNFPSKDSDGETYFSLDATPDKLRTIIQLATLPKADIGVSLYPQKKELNSPTDLMHRKVLRSGDKVLISGMNANLGSGENIDSGYIVEGEAATKLTQNLARDIQVSRGATLDDIWGKVHIDKFADSNLRLGKRGFISLLDSIGGPSQAGTKLPKVETLADLEKMAKKAGVKFEQLVDIGSADYENEVSKMLGGRNQLQLSAKGKKELKALIERAIEVTNTPENLARLDDMKIPELKSVGKARVDIADSAVEREALILSAISEATKFTYLPGFVITRAVAAALVARRDQLREEGKELDVRVIADAGLYPHGSNPNSYGVKFLEDHGIQARWAKLERSGDHDRKIHAKQLITDKGEITGSTNFSTQGLRENWETSAYIHFDKGDTQSLKSQSESVEQFEKLWDSSFELSTIDHAAFMNRDKTGPGKEWFIENGREQSVRYVLRLIGNYERESGKLHQELLAGNDKIAERKAAIQAEGYSYGDATLNAIQENLGPEAHRKILDEMGTADTLRVLQKQVQDFKEGKEVTAPLEEEVELLEEELIESLPPELFY